MSLILISCSSKYDTVITGGTIYDGLGGEPFIANVAINDGRIVKIGEFNIDLDEDSDDEIEDKLLKFYAEQYSKAKFEVEEIK